MSEPQASQPSTRVSDPIGEDTPDHRRRTTRQVRHTARAKLHVLAGDEEALEDAVLEATPVDSVSSQCCCPPSRPNGLTGR